MSEMKSTLSRMGFYYLLLAINIIPCAGIIPDRFPTRNLSTIYLLALAVSLVLYYSHRVSSVGSLSVLMKSLSWMALLLILLRGVKYSAFSRVGILARHTWYLYYLPLLLLPLFLFLISLSVSPRESAGITGIRRMTLALTLVFLLLVTTNDLHQQVFRFEPGFQNWDSRYSHGWLFYLITAWQYALYLAGTLILMAKCRISSARRNAWLLMIPFVIGIAMNVMLFTGTMPKLNGTYLVEFPEALICMAAVLLECCIQLGLIPSNTDYGKLFPLFSISAQITDEKGTPVYLSRSAAPLTAGQFAIKDHERIGAHTVLHRMKLPGGYGFWQDDMTELDRLNEELAEAKQALAQEGELIRLRNEWKVQNAKVEQRTLMYDEIARRTWRQSQEISRLAKTARLSSDPAEREQSRRRITLLGAFIKRYANLTLLTIESSSITVGELGLSVLEVLRYLNYCGIPGECICAGGATVPKAAGLAAFEVFEQLLYANLSSIQGVFVNLSGKRFKMTFEALSCGLTPEGERLLTDAGIQSKWMQEDNVTYLVLTLRQGEVET